MDVHTLLHQAWNGERKHVVSEFILFIESNHCATDCLILGGDANAHLAGHWRASEKKGKFLEAFCIETALTILSLTDACKGGNTRRTSCIESSRVLEIFEAMTIDEDRMITLSDHNLLDVVFSRTKHTVQPPDASMEVTNCQRAARLLERKLSAESPPSESQKLRGTAPGAIRSERICQEVTPFQ